MRPSGLRALLRRPRRSAARDALPCHRRGKGRARRHHRTRRTTTASRSSCMRWPAAAWCPPIRSRNCGTARTFLLASQLTLVSMDQAERDLRARPGEMAEAMPEPARTYMGYVNDRAVGEAGARHWCRSSTSSAWTTRRCHRSAPAPPRRRCSCCTATKTRSFRRPSRCCSATTLRMKGADVHVLLSQPHHARGTGPDRRFRRGVAPHRVLGGPALR